MLPPELLKRFQDVRLLDSGGMGVVYRAFDIAAQRPVAIKVLNERARNDPSFRKRFKREMRAMARVSHANVARIFDVSASGVSGPADELFLVMEFVDGLALTAWSPGRSHRAVLEVMASVADAVACVHEAGIVHRDLKPGNVLVARDGQPKLLDFGLALPLDDQERTRLTETGNVVGTLAYMSPEVLDCRPADARSDVYGLGLLLYECLAGCLPCSALELRESKAQRRKLAYRPPSSHCPSLPAGVDELVAAALALDPARRLPTAAGFRDAVLAIVAGRPLPALVASTPESPASEPPVAVPSVRPVRSPRAAVVVMAAALTAAAATSWWPREGAAPELALRPAASAPARAPRLVAGPFVYPSSERVDVDWVVDEPMARPRLLVPAGEVGATGPFTAPGGKRYSAALRGRAGSVVQARLAGLPSTPSFPLRFEARSVEVPPCPVPPRRSRCLAALLPSLPDAVARAVVAALPPQVHREVVEPGAAWPVNLIVGPMVGCGFLLAGDDAGRLLGGPWPADENFSVARVGSATGPVAVLAALFEDLAPNRGGVSGIADVGGRVAVWASRLAPGEVLSTKQIRGGEAGRAFTRAAPDLLRRGSSGWRWHDILVFVDPARGRAGSEVALECPCSPWDRALDDPASARLLAATLVGVPALEALALTWPGSRTVPAGASAAVIRPLPAAAGSIRATLLREDLSRALSPPVAVDETLLVVTCAEGAVADDPVAERRAPGRVVGLDAENPGVSWRFDAGDSLYSSGLSADVRSGLVATATPRSLFVLNPRRRTAAARAGRVAEASGPLDPASGEVALSVERVSGALGTHGHADLRFFGTPIVLQRAGAGRPLRLLAWVARPEVGGGLSSALRAIGTEDFLRGEVVALTVEGAGLRAAHLAGPFSLSARSSDFPRSASRCPVTGFALLVLLSHVVLIDPAFEGPDALVLHHDATDFVTDATHSGGVVAFATFMTGVSVVAASPTRLPDPARVR